MSSDKQESVYNDNCSTDESDDSEDDFGDIEAKFENMDFCFCKNFDEMSRPAVQPENKLNYTCGCGSTLPVTGEYRHSLTKKHKKYLKRCGKFCIQEGKKLHEWFYDCEADERKRRFIYLLTTECVETTDCSSDESDGDPIALDYDSIALDYDICIESNQMFFCSCRQFDEDSASTSTAQPEKNKKYCEVRQKFCDQRAKKMQKWIYSFGLTERKRIWKAFSRHIETTE
jgi:hypothetical protein